MLSLCDKVFGHDEGYRVAGVYSGLSIYDFRELENEKT